jgi:hypothetical protein
MCTFTLESTYTATINPIYVFPEKELSDLSPTFHIHMFVSDLYIPKIGPRIFLQQNRQTDCGKSYRSQTHEFGNCPGKMRKISSPPLLEGLSTLFKMSLDTLPNLSRDTVIFPTGNTPVKEDLAALFIGDSNADRLANSAATLGIISETVTMAGWILSTDAVTAILTQVIERCNSLPEDAPVVIYCLDNSSFCSANKDGQLSAITKLKDGLYHVPGELVVVHEVTLAAAVTNLKRILVACGNRRVFIITPGPRIHTLPCCCKGAHCSHLQVPDSGLKLMQDLAQLQLFISRRLGGSRNYTVIPACDLLSGKRNTSPADG